MANLFHKYQQPILIGITARGDRDVHFVLERVDGDRVLGGGGDKVASIYGQSIARTDIQRDVKKFRIAADLGLSELVQSLAGNAENQQQAVENYVWNSYMFDARGRCAPDFPDGRRGGEGIRAGSGLSDARAI